MREMKKYLEVVVSAHSVPVVLEEVLHLPAAGLQRDLTTVQRLQNVCFDVLRDLLGQLCRLDEEAHVPYETGRMVVQTSGEHTVGSK